MNLETLNTQQRQAVMHTEGPLLLLAGAGSGKTRVVTNRIAYLIEEKNVNPWNIMAITFTNKAAAEMRERVDDLVGFGSESIWVATFHSTCVRILRRHIDRIDYDNNFTIYDTDDQKNIMKDVRKRLNIDAKQMSERALLSIVSSCKNDNVSPEEFRQSINGDFTKTKLASVYEEYQKELKKNNALDFDDLLVKTVELFRACPDVLDNYQERFRYIMVDEYQDTNTVQFMLIKLLASKYENLCVVGDDDQSIYKFRGANITNILNFEKVYPSAMVIKLEQNYRSTANILAAANGVISHNRGRKDKALWTEKEAGEKIRINQYDTAYNEADAIANDIKKSVAKGMSYNSFACLYRTNGQSRILEEKLLRHNIPYKIVGGVNFYQRKEIKDILAYLKTIDNGRDDVAVKRIVNVPKRGIGLTSIDKIQTYADGYGMSFFDACGMANNILTGKAADKVLDFYGFIQRLRGELLQSSLKELTELIIDETEYIQYLKDTDKDDDTEAREDNINELISKVADYEESTEEPALSGLLEEIALVADVDSLEEGAEYVVLMTIHSAKGLEFPKVYLCGMEDGLFPSYMSIESENSMDELEEERRLCYVAITRAMKELVITYAKSRMIRGEIQYNKPSRFLREIPSGLVISSELSSLGNKGFTSGNSSSLNRASSGMSPMEFIKNSSSPMNMTGDSATRGAVSTFRKNAFEIKKTSQMEKPEGLEYGVGDKVRHIKFGIGQVINIEDGGRDFEVTVQFDNFGVKKLFASFAKLKKV